MTSLTPDVHPPTDTFELTIPAASEWVVLARTAAAAVAARADLSLDQLDDLTLAVDEAAAILLAGAGARTRITCRFTFLDDVLQAELSAPFAGPPPSPSSFAWLVLTSLADDVEATADATGLTLRLRLRRRAVPG